MCVYKPEMKTHLQFCQGGTAYIGGIRLQLKEKLYQGQFIFHVERVLRNSSFRGKIKPGKDISVLLHFYLQSILFKFSHVPF